MTTAPATAAGSARAGRRGRPPVRAMSERELQTRIVELCRWMGLAVYHTFDSRHSAAGFPDLVIVGGQVLFRELKSAKGALSADQVHWLGLLERAGSNAGIWRPRDWDSGLIREQLSAARRPARRATTEPEVRDA